MFGYLDLLITSISFLVIIFLLGLAFVFLAVGSAMNGEGVWVIFILLAAICISLFSWGVHLRNHPSDE